MSAAAQPAAHPPRRPRAGRCAGGPRHRHRVRRARRELSRRARRALRRRQPGQDRDLPLRGRCGQHGRSLRQADRPPRRRLRHPRPRRLPRVHRRAHRDAGQHAAAAVRRPDPVRGDRPRELPGSRLPPHVRPARQMGDPDRRRPPHPRTGRACRRRRDHAAGPARSSSRSPKRCSGTWSTCPTCRAPSCGRRCRTRAAHRRAARAARPEPQAARDPRRLRPGPPRDGRRSSASSPRWNMPVAVGFRRQALYDGTLPNFVGDLGVGSDPALVAPRQEADLDPRHRHPARPKR